MSRYARTTASAFAFVLTATILASSTAQAFGPRLPRPPRPSSPLPVLMVMPNMEGQVEPGFQSSQAPQGVAPVVRSFTVTRKLVISQPGLGLRSLQAPRGGIHIPAMTARVPTISASPSLR